MLSKIESGDQSFVQAPTSSASRLYQFILTGWTGDGGLRQERERRVYPTRGIGRLKAFPAEQAARAKAFSAQKAAMLKARGFPINRASLYAALFFGASMAAKVGADVNAARMRSLDLKRPKPTRRS